MNIVILQGCLARTPALKVYGEKNEEMIYFILAVSEYNSSVKEYKSMFIPCVAFGNIAQGIKKLDLEKGQRIVIEGKISYSTRKKEGTNDYLNNFSVVISKIELCGRNTSSSGNEIQPYPENVTDEAKKVLTVTNSELPF